MGMNGADKGKRIASRRVASHTHAYILPGAASGRDQRSGWGRETSSGKQGRNGVFLFLFFCGEGGGGGGIRRRKSKGLSAGEEWQTTYASLHSGLLRQPVVETHDPVGAERLPGLVE